MVGQLLTIQATHQPEACSLPFAGHAPSAGQVAFNIASLLRWRTRQGVHVELFIGLLIDVAAYTAQLYLSGGIGNQSVLYLLQIAVGPCCCAVATIWCIVVVASACVVLRRNTASPAPGRNVRDGSR